MVMIVWVHLVFLPMLYLADGKPRPFNTITKGGVGEFDPNSNITYHFDYNLFKNKTKKHSKPRNPKTIIEDRVAIEEIDAKINWNNIKIPNRAGVLFILKKGDNFVNNIILYSPNDNGFIVRGLFYATGYSGEIRPFKNNQTLPKLNTTKDEDKLSFRLDSPRIIPNNELKSALELLKKLPETDIKLESISISFKLPLLTENAVLEMTDLLEGSGGSRRALVEVVPQTTSVSVTDLPGQALLKVQLRTQKEILYSAILFTGAITGPPPSPLTRTIFDIQEAGKRLTVKCFVKDKPPFQGFPCVGSNICIPLHWECDGDEDCLGGFDESKCSKPTSNSIPRKCKKNEFGCDSRTGSVCLPLSWKCDGRIDCDDGSDEDKKNCKGIVNTSFFTSCDRDNFRCSSGGCVPNKQVCDSYQDCSDGSDERDCPEVEEELEEEDDDDDEVCDGDFEFTCDKESIRKKCIPRPWLCDDQNDCPLGEDESDDICNSDFNSFFEKKNKS